MNLHYMVEEAFDKLENAIAYAELHDSTSAADAERYAQLLDDVVGLRDGAKKETAPAVGATEAEEENRFISMRACSVSVCVQHREADGVAGGVSAGGWARQIRGYPRRPGALGEWLKWLLG